MIKIYFDEFNFKPIGTIQTAVCEDKLVCISVNKTIKEFLGQKITDDPIKDHKANNLIIEELKEYLTGERKIFTVEYDFIYGTEFQQTVWRELTNIPYGKTINYGELATNIGNPKASRAVGNANGKNPIPIVIPCHRVITTNNKLGGFSCGIEVKRFLLKLET